MLSIPGYKITRKLYESASTVIYRAALKENRQSFTLKILKKENPSQTDIDEFLSQFDIIKDVSINGIARIYQVENFNGRFALVIEDFNAISLKEYLKETLELKKFLNIAIKLSETIGDLHKNNIIHKNLSMDKIPI